MKYEALSIIIGRKKRLDKEDINYPCFISLYDINNPHTSGEVPKEILDYPKIHKVVIKGFDVNYLLPGNDLVVNNISELDISVEGEHIFITGKHKE